MDFIKGQLARIQQQLGGLTASQRMLAGTLVIIMVMTLFLWTHYAGQAEMEPILDTAFKPDEINNISQQLQARGVPYKISGDHILVAADRKSEVLAELAYSQALPQNTASAFDDMVGKMTPWDGPTRAREMFNQAKQMTLAQIIRNFPGVSNAMVIIDASTERAIGGAAIQPSATVNITMRSGMKAERRLGEAAADLVTGAVANLLKSRVHVIADGVPQRLQNDEDSATLGGSWLDAVKANEKYFADKLKEQLQFIEGAMIAVTVVPNNKSKVEEINRIDKAEVKSQTEDSTTDENETSAPAAAEPGVVPNGTAAVGGAAGGGGGEVHRNKKETNRVTNVVLPSKTNIRTQDRGGDAQITAASIFIPRSWFVKIFKKRYGENKEPDETALDPLIKLETALIRTGAAKCLGVVAEDSISVAPYTDLMPITGAAVVAPAAASSVTLMLSGHVKEIAVGALALISLFMMSMMVKKTAAPMPSTAATTAAPVVAAPKPTLQLGGAEESVGEAVEGSSPLDGMELDDDSVRSQQMVEQVSEMVKDNPDAAANLIKRWMNRA